MLLFYSHTLRRHHLLSLMMTFLLFASGSRDCFAQCPINIDFEIGNFTGWKCYTQNDFAGIASLNLLPTPPLAGRHDMLSVPPGNGLDPYGLFPQNCPNGSGHSVKIGASQNGGHTADKVSFVFTIPAGANTYNLIYHYAIVLNDASHPANQQPRLVIEVKNLTDGTPLPCPLGPIVATGNLPGFQTSNTSANGQPVRFKPWAAGSLNLDNNAGKTIELSFTTTGCGLFPNGSHFGYAYIDVNSECSSAFTGATFCPDDTLVNVTAPYGYQDYKWFNIFNVVLGTQQILTLNPPPLSGDSVFVELTPYNGYGCLDTLTAHLWDTLTIDAFAGRDTSICTINPVQLGRVPVPGLVYSWSPTTGLTDPNISNPIATVTISTRYILSVRHDGGGCLTKDTVNINIIKYDTTLLVTGPISHCSVTGQTVTLKVQAADSIQWYQNGIAIPGANQVQFIVTQSGDYSATLFSFAGCSFSTRVQHIDIFQSPAAGFTVDNGTQCLNGNQFIFTNTSTTPIGTLQYTWNLGDGSMANTANVNHTYALSGNYTVKMKVTGDGGCQDSSFMIIKVDPSPTAGFTVNTASQCFKNNLFLFTNTSSVSAGTLQYNWDLGDGTFLTSRDVTHSYLLPGTYTVNLVISSPGTVCIDTKAIIVEVFPSPVAGFNTNSLNQCFPGHQFIFTNTSTILAGQMLYSWSLGDGTVQTGTDVNYSYAKPGAYPVKLLVSAPGGCFDSASVNVNVYPMPVADFTVQPVCINLPVPIRNNTVNNTNSTVNYLWDFGNGQLSNLRTPVYSYPNPGTYTIKLSVNTVQCPQPLNTKQQDILVDVPVPGINYPVKDAVINFTEPLQARAIGTNVAWFPGTSLDNRNSYTPGFKGLNPQLYTIQLRTKSGCLTVDTQMVKTHKKIEIYVPTVFTPASSTGINDFLRPLLMGFDHVNYFKIFNRWGKLLFEMKSDRPGWNGRIGNNIQEMQTVVWMIEAVDVDGVTHQRKGTTILMR